MKVTVRNNERSHAVEVEADELVENLKAILEVEVPLMQQQIFFKGQEVRNSMRLNAAGIDEGAVLTLVTPSTPSRYVGSILVYAIWGAWKKKVTKRDEVVMCSAGGPSPWSIHADGSAANPVELQKHLRADHVALAQLQQRNPEIAQAVLDNDIELFQKLLRQQYRRRLELERQEQDNVQGRPSKRQHQEAATRKPNLIAPPAPQSQHVNHHPSDAEHDLMYGDPFNVDAQRRIEEAIRQKNVDENWEAAIEHNPKAFARVIMLYVDMEVNGVPLKAFVDSGAQSTIISMTCAERCGLLRLLDRRYVGIAKGVGESVIVGRIHVAPLKIGRNYYPCSFTVLDHADLEFIFGLDMLRKHQCTIDLKDNVLSVGGGEIAVPFLQEKDLPLHLHDDKRLEETPRAAEGNTSGKGVELHLPAPVHAPFVPATPRDGKRTSTSLEDEREANAKVQRLVDLGFDKKIVLEALSAFNGNEDQAASYLFGG